jgi:hypothetical protein
MMGEPPAIMLESRSAMIRLLVERHALRPDLTDILDRAE